MEESRTSLPNSRNLGLSSVTLAAYYARIPRFLPSFPLRCSSCNCSSKPRSGCSPAVGSRMQKMPLIGGHLVATITALTPLPQVSLRPGARPLHRRYVQSFTFVFLLMRLTCSFLGESTRWSLSSKAKITECLSCFSYLPLLSWQNSQRLWIIALARTPTILGWGKYDEVKAKHLCKWNHRGPQFQHVHQPIPQHDHSLTRYSQFMGAGELCIWAFRRADELLRTAPAFPFGAATMIFGQYQFAHKSKQSPWLNGTTTRNVV